MSTGNKKTQLLVRSQLPEFIANDYPKFVEFLKAYYSFVTQNYDVKVESLRDADNTASSLLVFLRRELLKNFPNSVINERKLINTIREIYSRKGNLDSIKLLFKLFFNDSIIIRQPGSQILRASDGKWFQYNAITLSQINWDKVSADILRAAVQIQPYSTLFNAQVNGWKIGDVNRSGTITSADALAIKKYSLNPENVTPVQKIHIEQTLTPALLNNVDFIEYIYSNIDTNLIVPEVSRLVIQNKFGRFTPTISKFEVESNKKIRFFFKSYSKLRIVNSQNIGITGQDGNIVFTGKHASTTNELKIEKPGRDWQKGQIITIPGSVKNTIARVLETDSVGGLVRIEILENGYSHDENLAIVVSPYPVKPSDQASYDVNTTVTAINPATGAPTAYNHLITMNDYTEGVTEELFGERNAIDYTALSTAIINAASNVEPDKTLFDIVYLGWKLGDVNHTGTVTAADAQVVSRYASGSTNITQDQINHIETILLPKLKDLIENINPASPPAYVGILYSIINPFSPVISISTTETNSVKYNFSELTFEEWVNSRAVLFFDRADIIKTKGYYLNDDSQVSNNEARLQDNYFYQLFSYLIETTKSEKEVAQILNQFHPAGLKYFFQLNKQNFYSIRDLLESYKSLSIDVVFARDFFANNTDQITGKDVVKNPQNDILNDFPLPFDEIFGKIVIKAIADALDTPEEYVAKDFIKNISGFDILFATDPQFPPKDVVKLAFPDFSPPSDAPALKDTIKEAAPDSTGATDTTFPPKSVVKLADEDSTTATEPEFPPKDFVKASVDASAPADSDPLKDFTKNSVDASVPADAAPLKDTEKNTTDILLPNDETIIKNFTKYAVGEDATLDGGDFISSNIEGYSETNDYVAFSEHYSSIENNVYVG
jgi:hypothetical protein